MNNKEKIFHVSVDLFSKYGYDGVSIRRIASEVGIKESSIYNHYKSKESILDSIMDYYIDRMLANDIPLNQASTNLDVGFDYFYRAGLNAFLSQLKDEEMSKITRIILIESFHNEKIKEFLKKSIIDDAVNGWIVLFDLMKSKRLIRKDCDSRQLAKSFYKYGLFLLYEHYIINYPEDDGEFLEKLAYESDKHIKLLYNSVKINGGNNIKIRLEDKNDYLEVENLVRDSFWNVYRPGAFEHYIVHNLRNDDAFIADLAYVIESDSGIIGHINYSRGFIDYGLKRIDAVVLGPIAIHRDYQNQGLGSRLIEYTLDKASDDFPFVIVIGDENYYHRFGFESASKYNLHLDGTDSTEECPFFMIKVFDEKGLENKKGIFFNPEVFDVNPKDVDEFDKKFEYKEKLVLDGQLGV
ncbi:MAG: GNAT family N-acetyltransferase [Methanobrevibacter sp.]|nr:GNAT family N-acetyltransferase [Methanobrevibacter sp.]